MANLYLGNLPREITESLLEEFLREAQCPFESIKLIRDMQTGEPRGFAFVELTAGADMQKTIQSLNGSMVNNRPLVVNEARPQQDRRGGGSGGGGGFGNRPRSGGFGGNRSGGGSGRGGGRGRY